VSDQQRVVRLEYPLTIEASEPGVYEDLLAEFYDRSAERLAAELAAGSDVAVVCEGDPFFYGSYMYLHQRLAHRFPTQVVPGVTSFSAAAAARPAPRWCRCTRRSWWCPGVLRPRAQGRVERRRRRGGHEGRAPSRRCARRHRSADLDAGAVYVERATCEDQRIVPLAETADIDAPYFSLVLVPGRGLAPPTPAFAS